MRWADTPRQVGESSDVVLSMLTDGAAVEAVTEGPDGLIAGLRPGAVYADMSTVSPELSRAVAERVAAAGATMLDAPVSGSPVTLAEGKLAIMVGGEEAALERIRPVLLDIGPAVTHIGPNGTAVQTKIAINLTLVVQMIAFCEGVALAEQGGVEREVVVDAMLKSVVASPVLELPRTLHPRGADARGASRRRDPPAEGHAARPRRGPPDGLAGAAHGRGERDAERGARPRDRRERLRRRPPRIPRVGGGRPVKPYRTTVADVPLERGLREDEGWIDMRVQFLIDERTAGSAGLVVGRTVLPPGARHERHRHPNCNEFLVVMSGGGEVYTDHGVEPSKAGDVIFTPAGHWHGFNNTSDEDVLLIWGWEGAGSLEAAGYELPE